MTSMAKIDCWNVEAQRAQTLDLVRQFSKDVKEKTKLKKIHPVDGNTIIIRYCDIDSPTLDRCREFVQTDKPIIKLKYYNKEGKLYFAKVIVYHILKEEENIDTFRFFIDKRMRGKNDDGKFFDTSMYLFTTKSYKTEQYRFHNETDDIFVSLNEVIGRVEHSFSMFDNILNDSDVTNYTSQMTDLDKEIAALNEKLSELHYRRSEVNGKMQQAIKLKIDVMKDF